MSEGSDHHVPGDIGEFIEDDKAVGPATEDRRVPVVRRFQGSAEDAALGRPEVPDVVRSPRRGDVPHYLLISSLRSLLGLKYRTFFGGTFTGSPVRGFRPERGGPAAEPEAAESADFDLLALEDGVLERVKKEIDADFGLLLRDVELFRDFGDKVGFNHRSVPPSLPFSWPVSSGPECF